ncbi:hypothetical protein PUN28_010686 [Cardiocondyla obscurior]|uniref:Uncharacterized protein n=1 Tax=Cardiocondyla obscurior TaxID=286306 RepID=A0AAW2FIS3_9HYME
MNSEQENCPLLVAVLTEAHNDISVVNHRGPRARLSRYLSGNGDGLFRSWMQFRFARCSPVIIMPDVNGRLIISRRVFVETGTLEKLQQLRRMLEIKIMHLGSYLAVRLQLLCKRRDKRSRRRPLFPGP